MALYHCGYSGLGPVPGTSQTDGIPLAPTPREVSTVMKN